MIADVDERSTDTVVPPPTRETKELSHAMLAREGVGGAPRVAGHEKSEKDPPLRVVTVWSNTRATTADVEIELSLGSKATSTGAADPANADETAVVVTILEHFNTIVGVTLGEAMVLNWNTNVLLEERTLPGAITSLSVPSAFTQAPEPPNIPLSLSTEAKEVSSITSLGLLSVGDPTIPVILTVTPDCRSVEGGGMRAEEGQTIKYQMRVGDKPILNTGRKRSL